MNTFTTSLVNELQKQFSRKKTYVLLIITAVIPIAAALLIGYFQGGLGITPVRGVDFPVYMLGVLNKLLLPLFIFMITADIFAGELSDRTIKTSLLRPVARYKIYASKIACTGICTIVFLGVLFIISAICSLFLGTGGTFAGGILSAAGQYCAAFLPLLLLGIVSSFIAMLTASSSGALVISILVFIAAKTVSLVIPGMSGFMFTSYTDWYLLLASGVASAAKILSVFMFMVSYSIIFIASGYLLFEKKEL